MANYARSPPAGTEHHAVLPGWLTILVRRRSGGDVKSQGSGKAGGRLGASILPASARASFDLVSNLHYQRDGMGAGTRGVRSALSACRSTISPKG